MRGWVGTLAVALVGGLFCKNLTLTYGYN